MYSISQLIYGVPVEAEKLDSQDEGTLLGACIDADNEEGIPSHEAGFRQYYHGQADEQPTCYGIELGRWDECYYYTNVSDLPRMIETEEERNKYDQAFAKLNPKVQATLAKFGKPRVFILWTTS